MNYVRQTDFSEVSRFHLSHNKLWRKLNRLRSEKYGSLKAVILRCRGYIATPIEQPYLPLHYSLKSYCQRYPMPNSQPYQRFFKPAKPPLMLAVIDGEPNLPQLRRSGKYQVRLDISKEKTSLPLRIAKAYGGKKDAGPFGLEFPLHGGTKVLVSMVNDCPQKLVILGALYKTNQPPVVNNKNQSQYAMQTVGGQGFVLDDATYGIYLFNPKDSQYFAMTGEGEAADITLATKTGSVHLFSKEGVKLVAGSDLKMEAETIQHHVDGNQQTQAKNVNLKAKDKISAVAENIFQQSESLVPFPFSFDYSRKAICPKHCVISARND